MPTINYIMDDLEEENKNLREKIKRLNNDNTALQHTVDDFVVKCKDLQSAYDKEHSRWVELAENYDRLETKYKRLEREHSGEVENEIDELKKQIASLENELEEEHKARIARDELCIEKERRISCLKQDLQQQVDMVGKNYCEAAKRVGELVREKGDLQRQLDSLNTAMGRLRERYEEEVVCRRKWANLAGYRDKRIEELQRQIDILKQRNVVFVDLDSVKLKGMEELWAMIREVNSAPIESLYDSGAFNNKVCVGTMVDMYPDVRDFIKEYKTWKKGKEDKDEEKKKQKCLDDMRDYLHKFCENRWCDECPLSTDEFKCGRGYRFRKWCFPDNGAIPDEDLKRYYEKVRDWEKKEEEKPSDEEVPCSFGWKLDGTEFTIETSIPREAYDNIVKNISGKE